MLDLIIFPGSSFLVARLYRNSAAREVALSSLTREIQPQLIPQSRGRGASRAAVPYVNIVSERINLFRQHALESARCEKLNAFHWSDVAAVS
jgi:hypothetical protein